MSEYKAASRMNVRRQDTQELCTIFLEGQFDTAAAAESGGGLLAEMDSPSTTFVIDMEKLTYLASGGIRVLISMLKKSKASGKTLRLKSLQPMVHDVLEITGMLRLFETV